MKKLLFTLSLVLSFNANADNEITIVAQTDPNDATTKCGDNCTWKLYSDGKLEISGTGDMYDYYSQQVDSYVLPYNNWTSEHITSAPWGTYALDITRIEISEGIESIGSDAFYQLAETSIIIPESVTRIGSAAFMNSAVENIAVPQGTTYIDDYAFYTDASLYCPENLAAQCRTASSNPSGVHVYTINADGTYSANGKKYANFKNMQKNKEIKRIYTIEEANKVTGKTNRVSIKYR